ncbi:elongation factor P [Candidatus Saccharibacteria bacterium]|nr:elongation factor P [Candidatus Saccharibacteria bacterium]
MALGVTDLKKGMVFAYEGTPYIVTEYSQKVMGRGGSIVNVKTKSLLDGKVIDRTFKGNEQFDYVDLNYKNVQYLYNDGTTYFFMDNDNYEQFELPADVIGDQSGFMKEGDTVKAMILDGRCVSVELPKNVYLKVISAPDVVRGDTSSSVLKDVELETGISVKAPAFIKVGDEISVDTTTWEYRERKK